MQIERANKHRILDWHGLSPTLPVERSACGAGMACGDAIHDGYRARNLTLPSAILRSTQKKRPAHAGRFFFGCKWVPAWTGTRHHSQGETTNRSGAGATGLAGSLLAIHRLPP